LGAADFLAHKYRNVEIDKLMEANTETVNSGGRIMEFLIALSVLVVWIVLQAWVLPRLGVPT
jgi:hypothetical protein